MGHAQSTSPLCLFDVAKNKMDFVYVGALCWLLLLFISNITCSHDCHPIDQCSCKLDNGQKINLWEIDKGAGEGYTYYSA